MLCSKIGSACPHPVTGDDNFVFVIMPFKGFETVYYTLQNTVQGLKSANGKNFICERADEKYTTSSIWCKSICANIRKAKYLIVDTTGKNANVLYELGFAHALETTTAILITQNVADAPFDISDLDHIQYTADKPRELEANLKRAIESLEKEEEKKSFRNKTGDEIVIELKSQLIKEEERAAKFKSELYESEDRERKLKERIKEIEAINENPSEEAMKQITSLEGAVAQLKTKLKLTEQSDNEEISRLDILLKEKEEKLKILEREFESFKQSKDEKSLATLLMDDSKRKAEAVTWLKKGFDEVNKEKKIQYYTKAIELNPDETAAYINRGVVFIDLKEYNNALMDLNKVIELKPNDALAYNNRGLVYFNLKQNARAIIDYSKVIELEPNNSDAYSNRGLVYSDLKQYENALSDLTKAMEMNPGKIIYSESIAELSIITGDYKNALKIIENSLRQSLELEQHAIFLYLECIARKVLALDVSESEKKFAEILKKDFKINWSFESFELWLSITDIDDDKKAFIIEKTERLKKYKL